MNKRLSEIFEDIEERNNCLTLDHIVVPKDLLYRKVKKTDMKRIIEALNAVEMVVENKGVDILLENSKTFIDKEILKQQLILNKLNMDTTLTESLRETILSNLINEKILTEGFIDAASNTISAAKNAVIDKTKKIATQTATTINNWMNVTLEEVRKVILTFAAAMGEFGKTLVAFLKGFTDIDIKAAWVMIKNKDFVSLTKSVGNWLMQRVSDGIILYNKIYEELSKGIFANLAGTTPVVALRNWLQTNVQDKLNKIIDPDTGNPQIKKIINEKYNGNVKEALNDKEIIRLTLADKGIYKTTAGLLLRTGVGTLLAYIAWKTWNAMVFKGELIYDYDFSAAFNAIAGKFNVADWFLSTDGGFETLLLLIAGKMGMPSLASSDTSINIKIAVVITLIMIWIKKNPDTWQQIKESDFAKKIINLFQESKRRLSVASEAVINKFSEIKNIVFKIGFIKKASFSI